MPQEKSRYIDVCREFLSTRPHVESSEDGSGHIVNEDDLADFVDKLLEGQPSPAADVVPVATEASKATDPTEEHLQAAREWIALDLDMRNGVTHIARLLAEREASHLALIAYGVEVAATLRARVAELEAFTLLTDSERTSAMFAAGLDVVTRAVREADQLHQTVGGGTRHYVNECLLPCLKDEGLAIIVVGKAHYDDAKADAPASTEGGEG